MIDGAPSAGPRPARGPRRQRLWSNPRGTRLYLAGDRHRARRATDVVLLLLCLAGFGVLAPAGDPPSGFEDALTGLARAVPTFLDAVWRVGVGSLAAWGLVLIVAGIVRWRLAIVRDQVLALVGAGLVLGLIGELVGAGGRGLWDGLTAVGPPPDPVSARLALVAAVTVVASPHLTRPFRTVGRWVVGVGTVSLVVLEATTPSGALLGLLAGLSAASIVHLLFGSNAGRPSLAEVRWALDELGVEVTDLSEAVRQEAGVFVLDAVGDGGRPLMVKVYGRDAWDTQVLVKAWRSLWYRDVEALTLTRLQQVEHEGLVTLLAGRNGVPVHDVVRAGRTAGRDALLVLRVRGEPLAVGGAAGAGDATVAPAVLDGLWDTVTALGDAGFAHGDLAPDRFRVDGPDVVVDGLAGAAVAPSGDQVRIDLAQLLVTSALLFGPDTAVATAERRLGADGLAGVLPYLQPAALGARLRQAMAAAELDLADLRQRSAARAGVEEPTLAKIRRVSVGTLLQAGLLVAAAYFLISSLAGVDLTLVADAVRGASPGLLLVALVLAQTPRVPQAEATRGACPRPLAYGPVLLLQYAITFINLVVPATAARVAVNVRFFQKQGIPPASAVSIGVIDSLGGFAAQLLVLASVVLFGFGDLELDLDRPESSGGGGLLALLGVAALLLVVVALVVALVPRFRARVLDRIRPWVHEAVETVATLRSPGKVARVIGGNLASELLFASTMGMVLAALGTSLPLGTLLVINVSVSLFAGLMPVPGGIGVAEGALMVGLTAAGLDEPTALAATVCYRICTYYLPPVWGGLAFRRMERSGLL